MKPACFVRIGPRGKAVALTLFSAMAMLAGCQGMQSTPTQAGCTPIPPDEFVYALNSNVVSMFSVNSCTGALTPTSPSTVATGTSEGQIPGEEMTASGAGTFVYVANLVSNASDEATISMYSVNIATGILTPTTPSTVPTGFFPQGITAGPTVYPGIPVVGAGMPNAVYTANSDDNTISMFQISAATGVLTPTVPPTVATGNSPLSVTLHPSGKFAYVANQDDDTISMYTVNTTTAVLTPMTPSTVPTGVSPFAVTIDPSGRFAYVPDAYDGRNCVSQYTINANTGVLTPNGIATVGEQPTAVAIDGAGKFAYVTNRSSGTVSMFAIDQQTGALSSIGNGIIPAGSQPFRLVVDAYNQFVYVANEGSPISIYTINSDGTLTASGTAATQNGGALSLVRVLWPQAVPVTAVARK